MTQYRPSEPLAIVARAIDRVRDFDRLAAAATAVARVTTKMPVDFEWGPLLEAAFRGHVGAVVSEPQRRFLSALVDNQPLWDNRFGNAVRWVRSAGIPYDRSACARLVAAA